MPFWSKQLFLCPLTKIQFVKTNLLTILTMVLLNLAVVSPSLAAVTYAAATYEKNSNQTPNIDIPAPDLVPHKAIYDISMSSTKTSSGITGISGEMIYERNDVCQGWAVRQNIHMRVATTDGNETNFLSDESSYESKDGKNYRFNVKHHENGKLTETYRGTAILGPDGGNVTYSLPEDKKTLTLDKGEIFPSAHMALMLMNAQKGEKFFNTRVFDGAEEEGHDDVSVFIGKPLDQAAKFKDTKNTFKNNALLQGKAWSVRYVSYKPQDQGSQPDYQMDLLLFDNGISDNIRIDYEDFAIKAVLKKLETLPAKKCSN